MEVGVPLGVARQAPNAASQRDHGEVAVRTTTPHDHDAGGAGGSLIMEVVPVGMACQLEALSRTGSQPLPQLFTATVAADPGKSGEK
jgi:hypothetical protein